MTSVGLRQPSALGLGRPTTRALTTAALVSVVCLVGYGSSRY